MKHIKSEIIIQRLQTILQEQGLLAREFKLAAKGKIVDKMSSICLKYGGLQKEKEKLSEELSRYNKKE